MPDFLTPHEIAPETKQIIADVRAELKTKSPPSQQLSKKVIWLLDRDYAEVGSHPWNKLHEVQVVPTRVFDVLRWMNIPWIYKI